MAALGLAAGLPQRGPLRPQRLTPAGLLGGPEPVFVKADRRGGVWLFQAGEPAPYPLRLGDKLGAPAKLRSAETSPYHPLRVEVSGAGDWLLFEPPTPRLFRGDKEEPLPRPEWSVRGIGFVRDTPLVSVAPWRTSPGKARSQLQHPPLILSWSGREWETLVAEPLPAGSLGTVSESTLEQRMILLLGDSQGKLWVANEKLYRLRRFSSGGRLLLELKLGPQSVEPRSDAAERQAKMEAEARTWAPPRGTTVTASAAVGKDRIAALVEGRDGKIYLIACEPSGAGAYSLDRFDPLTLELERAPLALPAAPWLTAAAGREALYFATTGAAHGLWKLPWEQIQDAAWERLKDARLDRIAAPEEETVAPPKEGAH